jgi:hypothetical protein
MDRMMLKQAIERIENERAVHDEKFANNPVHKDCLPRFDKVLDNLRSDLKKEEVETNQQS